MFALVAALLAALPLAVLAAGIAPSSAAPPAAHPDPATRQPAAPEAEPRATERDGNLLFTVGFSRDRAALEVVGVAPGGVVSIHALSAREHYLSATALERHMLEARDDDADGVVTFILEHPAAVVSVWLVLDVAQGHYAIATPEGFTKRELSLQVETDGGVLHIAHAHVRGVLLRRGVGAWSISLDDASAADRRALPDDAVEALAIDFEPLAETAPTVLDAFVPGDLLLLVDPATLAVAELVL